ncbi:LysR substrate-binding domain-containing protein [Oceaniglobus trochenteri]|uniref:LysR substrate-binding domain-containing protein n=1 Tax=Oceaniglobus trochenteri TaxID=2763260 RepID=UPI001CFFF880|nr:LysR substrate-binding domain-containing protein [Oceaniglobus trochenteri]
MILNLPFGALRAFEAVVRCNGFSAAASELGVSQSAVSQHVKALEEWLGQELLTRRARRTLPTREGEQLARAISEGLGRISEVCADLRDRRRADDTIVISCLPGFAFTWLFPRLVRFDLAHPDITISISTDRGAAPMAAGEADLAIRYGFGHHPGLHVERLIEERLFPVCCPSLLTRGSGADIETFLAKNRLLHDVLADFGISQPSWDYWAQECGVSLHNRLPPRRFGQSNMVIQAAIEGLGVALGREPLVIDALCDGRLVRPFDQIAASPLSYWLVCPPHAPEVPKIRMFMDWLRHEVATQPRLPAAISAAYADGEPPQATKGRGA